ncbi:MAG: glutamate synthase central domain-containing protein, partial [Alphaproteobacteria bacterium]
MKDNTKATPTLVRGLPPKQGLYDPANERDACGIGFVAHIKNQKSREIIDKGLLILANLAHRGAVGADPKAGDGCGILLQMPHRFLVTKAGEAGFDLPDEGMYGVGNIFLPRDKPRRQKCVELIERIISEEGQGLLGWRDIPVDNSDLGETVRPTEPFHAQLFIGRAGGLRDVDAFERKLLVIRKKVFNELWNEHPTLVEDFYIPALSSRTLLYKGMVLANQLGPYYLDLQDPQMVSGLALVHQRFSTNTFPTWRLAQPFRMVCHNGEINTVRGNVNWIKARFATMKSQVLGEDIKNIWPIVVDSQSDSASFDCVLELLVQCGYSLAHAMTTLIPEAWAGNPLMSADLKAFYQYHAALMEPWDGPAAIAFTDGRQIGAMLDRNGLRPARYLITDDDLVVLSSETGVLPIDEASIVAKKRLRPGNMLLIDLEKGCIVSNAELKSQMAAAYPYQAWLDNTQIVLEEMDDVYAPARRSNVSLFDMQKAFGYTQEDLKILLAPMATTGQEALGSMGTDTPLSALSKRSKLLPTYFKQLFAQVTNPPIDPIREESVMSLVSFIGPRPNLLDPTSTASLKRLEVRQPILKDADLEKIRAIGEISDNYFQTITLDITFGATRGPEGLKEVVQRICERAEKAVGDGYNIIILSDRLTGPDRVPVPALLATSAVHHHLITVGLRTSVGLVVETGEAREVHHFCTLAGFGAEAINPYLAFETVDELRHSLSKNVTRRQAIHRYIKAIDKGILKVMSKMGISTYQSYCGAQIFDAVGL